MDRTLELDKREKLLSAAVLRKLRGCVVDDVVLVGEGEREG